MTDTAEVLPTYYAIQRFLTAIDQSVVDSQEIGKGEARLATDTRNGKHHLLLFSSENRALQFLPHLNGVEKCAVTKLTLRRLIVLLDRFPGEMVAIDAGTADGGATSARGLLSVLRRMANDLLN